MPTNGYDPANPWSYDAFAPVTPEKPEGVHVPQAPRTPQPPKAPRAVPALDDLFTVQRNTLKVLNDVDDLEHELSHLLEGKDAKKAAQIFAALKRDSENAYRVIRSYLDTYGN